MTAVEHFAYGWITPVLAFALAFLGCLLGVFLTGRSRASSGGSRARWLTLSAVAIGGSGTWVPHFMAMLGVDVPNTAVRYDVPITALGLGISVVVYCLGGVPGTSLFALLTPVCVLACLLLSGLAYSAVGFSVRQDTASEEALLRRARDMYSVATLARAVRLQQHNAHRRAGREGDRGVATVPR